jgi:hypothetical protein
MGKVGKFYGIWNIPITAIWYILRAFGNLVATWNIFSPFLVYFVKKNLATLFKSAFLKAYH